jgi:hypothetical protein
VTTTLASRDVKVSATLPDGRRIADRLTYRGAVPLAYFVWRGSDFMGVREGDELLDLLEDYEQATSQNKRFPRVRVTVMKPDEAQGRWILTLEAIT